MDLTKLYEMIVQYFNEEELKTLCFYLSPSVDYESLAGLGKSGKVRELVMYCERHRRITELISICSELRPKVDWGKYVATPQNRKNFQIEKRASTSSMSKPDVNPKLKVFLCHASGDKNTIRELYHNLKGDGFEPWLDEEDLLPGQEWSKEISKAVRSSDVVLVCLSKNAVSKRGYVHKEIKIALDVADEQPEGVIFLIPARLDECDVPDRLNHLQRVDLHHVRGYERLRNVLLLKFYDLYGSPQKPNFDVSEIASLIEIIGWRQSREGYSSTSPISDLKSKLLQMRKSFEKSGNEGDNLNKAELGLLIETVHENVNYISQYNYIGMSTTEVNRQRANTLAPLFRLQEKLEFLKVNIDD